MLAQSSRRLRCRRLLPLVPAATLAGITVFMLRVQETPSFSRKAVGELRTASGRATRESFQYTPDREVYAFDFDPHHVRIDLLEGWGREQDAYRDTSALAYVSGPRYEKRIDNSNQYIAVPLGELKLEQQVWRNYSHVGFRQQAFIGIRHNGSIEFGYGELTQERMKHYDTFIGGLHSIYNKLKVLPPNHIGAHNTSIGQRIGYRPSRIRVIFGLLANGRIEILMSRNRLTLEETRDLAQRRSYLAAYMPDHASKSRFIIPGVKGFAEENNNWISEKSTSFAHVPYMLRLSSRRTSLRREASMNFALWLNISENYKKLSRHISPTATYFSNQVVTRINKIIDHSLESTVRTTQASDVSKQVILDKVDKAEEASNTANIRRPSYSPLPKHLVTINALTSVSQLASDTAGADNEPEKHIPVAGLRKPWDLSPDSSVILTQDDKLSTNVGKQILESSVTPNLPESSGIFNIVVSTPPPILPPAIP